MSAIRTDGETQPRTAINPGIVQEYAEAMESGVQLPSVIVVFDGATYWLIDGFHRFYAHRRCSRTAIQVEVLNGELADAQWLCLAANKTHGLRRSNEDKAKAVTRALKLRPDLGNPTIAEHVGVDEKTVRRYREILEQRKASQSSGSEIPNLPTRVGRDGKRYPARHRARRTGRIAKNAFQPVRGHSSPQPMRALNMPQDPVMGARTLIELFDATYLRALVAFLTKHLEGAAA
jgi:hypothetical protein